VTNTGAEFKLDSPIDTPSLVLDLEIFERNMLKMLKICATHGISLQPHAKTHRTAEIGALQQKLGADGLCVAKIGEAEGFTSSGVKRITVAYPIVGEAKIRRAIALAKKVDLSLGVDSVQGAKELGKFFGEAGLVCKVVLIIDSGLGRDGVAPEAAAATAKEIASIPNVTMDGIMTHEGIVYGAANQAELERASREVAELMVHTGESIRAAGIPLPRISMGASASAKFVATVAGVTQIRPGIFAFNDLGQVALGNADFEDVAIRVFATVVSRSTPHTAVIDAGSKTLSQDLLPAKELRHLYPGHGLIVGKPGWVIDRLSEEHGVLAWRGEGQPISLEIGEVVQVIPNHVCTVFSSLNETTAVRSGKVVGHWRTFEPGASR